MADNVQITEGSGTAVHADEYTHATFGAGKTQLVKIVYGAPGTGIDAIAGAGAVTTGTPRVTLASDDPAVTALQVIDDWDESDRAKVNPIVGQAGIAAGAGAVGVTVPRVTLASDDPGVVALQIIDDWDETDRAKVNIIAGVAGVTAGAGAVAAGTPRVTLASDDPAVAHLANVVTAVQLIDNAVSGAGFNITQWNGAAVPIGAGTEAAALRVTIATDSTGVVSVDDNGASLTVDYATTGSGNATGALRVELANNGTGVLATVGAVTAITNALPAGTNAIGKVGHDSTGIGHGVTTVTTAGTDVALAASTACKWVSIQSQTDNTGKIAVGATGVDATVATGTGILLNAGDILHLPVDNLADVFIDSTVNGEGVRYTYGT